MRSTRGVANVSFKHKGMGVRGSSDRTMKPEGWVLRHAETEGRKETGAWGVGAWVPGEGSDWK